MITTENTAQQIAQLLALVGALISGEPVKTTTFPDGVEVIGISRMNHPDAQVYVELATPRGHRSYEIDEIEFSD